MYCFRSLRECISSPFNLCSIDNPCEQSLFACASGFAGGLAGSDPHPWSCPWDYPPGSLPNGAQYLPREG